jgi:hypothetical protein
LLEAGGGEVDEAAPSVERADDAQLRLTPGEQEQVAAPLSPAEAGRNGPA